MKRLLLAAILCVASAAASAQVVTQPTTVPGYLGVPCGADVTASVNAALSAGGNVILPACPATNPLIFSSTINIPSNASLGGQGSGITWLQEAASANLNPAIQNANAAGGAGAILDTNVSIHDLSIDGNGANQTSVVTNRCIYFLGVDQGRVENVEIKNCRSDALTFNGNSAPFPSPGHSIFVRRVFVNGVVGTGSGNGGGIWVQNRQRNYFISDSSVEYVPNIGFYVDASDGTLVNSQARHVGFNSSNIGSFCGNAGTTTVDNPGGGGSPQNNWVPCPPGFYFHNLTNLTASALSASLGGYYGFVIVGTRYSTLSSIVATQNSLRTTGTWDDIHLDLNNVGYGENDGLVISGFLASANVQVTSDQNGINAPTSRYGLFVADGLAGSIGSATISNGGTGGTYVVNDILSITGGTNSETGKFQVKGVSGGVINALDNYSVTGMGVYTALPPNPVALSGGGGSGAKANVVWTSARIDGLIGPATTAASRLPAFRPGWDIRVAPAPGPNLITSMLQAGNGTTYSSTANAALTTAADLSCFGAGIGTQTIPANSVQVGTKLRVSCRGIYTTPAGNAATVASKIKWGSTVIATASQGALPASQTNNWFTIDADCTVRTIGATGSAICNAQFYIGTSAAASGSVAVGSSTTTTIDTTVDALLDATFGWSSVAGGQTATGNQASLQVIN